MYVLAVHGNLYADLFERIQSRKTTSVKNDSAIVFVKNEA